MGLLRRGHQRQLGTTRPRHGSTTIRKAVSARKIACALAVLVLAGCGGSHNPWAVKNGMTQEEVRSRAGHPESVQRFKGESCWAYPAHKKGTSIDYLTFCFRNGRVARRLIGSHL
jgi:hypothetical protein